MTSPDPSHGKTEAEQPELCLGDAKGQNVGCGFYVLQLPDLCAVACTLVDGTFGDRRYRWCYYCCGRTHQPVKNEQQNKEVVVAPVKCGAVVKHVEDAGTQAGGRRGPRGTVVKALSRAPSAVGDLRIDRGVGDATTEPRAEWPPGSHGAMGARGQARSTVRHANQGLLERRHQCTPTISCISNHRQRGRTRRPQFC